MAGGGLEVDVIVIAVGLGALVVHGQVDIALPRQVFDHRLGLHDLLDAGQLDGLGRFAIGQGDLAIFGGTQRFGFLAGIGVLLDQQFLVAFQRLDLLPVQRDRACVLSLEQQLATIKHGDLAAEPVTIFHPHRIRYSRRTGENGDKAQQDSRKHKQGRTLVCKKVGHYPDTRP
ncbi:hypothetical protein D3C79_806430 [compost metagenome]